MYTSNKLFHCHRFLRRLPTMVSLRFPFSFSQPSKPPPKPHHSPPSPSSSSSSSSSAAIITSFITLGIGTGLAISQTNKTTDLKRQDSFLQNAWGFFLSATPDFSSPLWGSLSLANSVAETAIESKTGVAFPVLLDNNQRLLGTGVRKKSIMGLKNIDVYAFGVYADDKGIKNLLNEKYGTLSVSELKENKEFYADVLDQDLCMTVRLQIVYGRLSIQSVRSAFEDSVGSRLQKFSGSDNKELLQRFTSQFKDEYKIPRGSVIELSKEQDHILHTKIDGQDVGSIQSKLLCRSVLDLYIGEDPFDKQAKEDIQLGLASVLRD